MPTYLHGLIVAQLIFYIKLYLKENPVGTISTEPRFSVGIEDDFIPDIAFLTKDKEIVRKGAVKGAPDLAIEVQSPGQSRPFMLDKAKTYLANGTTIVWLVYPEKRVVEIISHEDSELYVMGDIIAGEPLLPNFRLPVKDIFEGV
jgi:Uma2 family endonuclease